MGIKSYRGPRNLTRIDGSEPINSWVRQIATRQTYPAIRRRNVLSLDADPVNLYFYQKLLSGRRCTCWGKDANPHVHCANCFGQGIVGGYNKFGTSQVVVDTSLPEVRVVGLVRETELEGPEVWVLEDEALTGYLEARIHFQGNWGPLDHLSTLHYTPDGSVVRWTIRALGQSQYVPLNRQNLEELFTRPQLLEVRMECERPGLEAHSPVIVNAHLRIKRTPETEIIVKANRPKITHAYALAELGVLDEYTTAVHWLDHTISQVTSNDWFYNTDEEIRWRVVDVSDLAPQNYLLSREATCRRVLKSEPIAKYPV